MIMALSGPAATQEAEETEALPPLKDAPEGFAGLKWGDPPDGLEGDATLFDEENSKGPEQYVLQGEDLAWDDFRISEASFSFREKKLVLVRLTFINSADAEKLKDHLIEKFGNPSLVKEINGGVSRLWEDEEIGVTLRIFPGKPPELGIMNHKLAMSLAG
jgi:hypothetical protein